MAASAKSEMEIVLSEDKTTSKLIKALADKEKSTPEQVTKDVAKMFEGFSKFLQAKEQNSSSVDATRSESKTAISSFLDKYGLKSDMAESIMEKMSNGIPSSSEIPSSDVARSDEEEKKLSKGKKFKIFLICAAAVLMVMNIVKKAKK